MSKKKTETRGRKALPKSKLRNQAVRLWLTRDEKKRLEELAGERPVATYIREQLLG